MEQPISSTDEQAALHHHRASYKMPTEQLPPPPANEPTLPSSHHDEPSSSDPELPPPPYSDLARPKTSPPSYHSNDSIFRKQPMSRHSTSSGLTHSAISFISTLIRPSVPPFPFSRRVHERLYHAPESSTDSLPRTLKAHISRQHALTEKLSQFSADLTERRKEDSEMWRDIEQMNRFAEELEEGLVEVRFDLVEERLLKEAKWYCNDGLAALKVAIGRETRRLVEAIEEEVGETMEGLAEEDGEYGEAMERHYGEAIEDEAYGQSMEDNERMEEADDDDLSPLLELGNPMSDGEY